MTSQSHEPYVIVNFLSREDDGLLFQVPFSRQEWDWLKRDKRARNIHHWQAYFIAILADHLDDSHSNSAPE